MNNGIFVYGVADPKAYDQMLNIWSHPSTRRAVLTADNHFGFGVPVGGVTFSVTGDIDATGVGFDIGCGNTAYKLSRKYSSISHKIGDLMDDIVRVISFGIGRKNNARVPSLPLFMDTYAHIFGGRNPLVDPSLESKAVAQLGTVGSGNHYVDLFRDESDDSMWVGVHFGSRGFGHGIATAAFKAAGIRQGHDEDLAIFHQDSDLGEAYIEAMNAAGEYARLGREWVCDTVSGIVGGDIIDRVNNHHNFAWIEEHDGREGWVVRKGATPLFPGQRGFIGANMRDVSVIVEGVDSPTASQGLYSAPHGAGRVMGRRAAIREFTDQDFADATQNIEIRGGGLDELPKAYKVLDDVLASHDNLRVVSRLIPVGVAMAGHGEKDPYKD